MTQPAAAQQPAHQDGDFVYVDDQAFLEDVVGRIALYPDPLIAIVLPAATYPLQIVQAARFLEDYDRNPALQPNPDWDDSVIALLNYPEVLAMMNEDLDWTWSLGDAVLYDQDEVLAAIQGFRDQAYLAGNLRSDEHQLVSRNDTVIEVVPVQPEVIYVPYYEPRRVIYRQPAPVIWYYPRAYPLYYYPYPADYLFPNRYFWGVTTVFSIGWRTRHVHVHHYHYSGHPYFGYHYHVPYYVRAPRNVTNINIYVDNRRGDVWQAGNRGGSRPQSVTARDSNRRGIQDYTDRRTDTARPDATATAAPATRGSRINERFDARVASRSAERSAERGAEVATRSGGTTPRTEAATTRTSQARSQAGARDSTQAPSQAAARADTLTPSRTQARAAERPDSRTQTRTTAPTERPTASRLPAASAPATATQPRAEATQPRTPATSAPATRSSAASPATPRQRTQTQRATSQDTVPRNTAPSSTRSVQPAPRASANSGTTTGNTTSRSTVGQSRAPSAPATATAPAARAAPATRAAPTTRAAPATRTAPSTPTARTPARQAAPPQAPAQAPAARSNRTTTNAAAPTGRATTGNSRTSRSDRRTSR